MKKLNTILQVIFVLAILIFLSIFMCNKGYSQEIDSTITIRLWEVRINDFETPVNEWLEFDGMYFKDIRHLNLYLDWAEFVPTVGFIFYREYMDELKSSDVDSVYAYLKRELGEPTSNISKYYTDKEDKIEVEGGFWYADWWLEGYRVILYYSEYRFRVEAIKLRYN